MANSFRTRFFNLFNKRKNDDTSLVSIKKINEKTEKIIELEKELSEFTKSVEIDYIKANMLLNDAKETNNPELLLKAFDVVQKVEKQLVDKKVEKKGELEDFMLNLSVLGFRQKIDAIDWRTLEKMSQFWVVRMVHKKLIDIAVKCAQPQKDKFNFGFYFERKDGKQLSEHEIKVVIPDLQKIIMQCGLVKDKITGNFSKFISEWMLNSLTYDHPPVEKIWTKGGKLHSWRNLPANSIFFAESYNEDIIEELGKQDYYEKVNGHYPAYVQMFDGLHTTNFYEHEIWLSLRNPSTSPLSNFYGRSELEDLILIVTYLANSIRANGQTFEDGWMGRGFLNIKGGASSVKINELRNYLRASGYGLRGNNALFLTDSEKAEYIKIQESNKDMEYSVFVTLLISIITGMYGLNAEIIGMEGRAKASINYEANFDDKIKTILSSAVEPILRVFAEGFNENIMNELYNDEYRFCFGGIHAETQMQNIEKLIKKSQLVPFNEILKEFNLPEVESELGNMVLSNAYISAYNTIQQNKMAQQQSQQQGQQNDMSYNWGSGENIETPQEMETNVEKSVKNNDLFENYFNSLILEKYNNELND